MADEILETTPDTEEDLTPTDPEIGNEGQTEPPVEELPEQEGEETLPEDGEEENPEGENEPSQGEGEVETPDNNEEDPEEPSEEEEIQPPVVEEEVDDGFNGTQFSAIYNRFLGKITDDMYMELTPDDTIRDLQNLLTDAIPGFEFPRVNISDYKIKTKVINEADAKPGDFILAVLWEELPEDGEQHAPDVLVERSCFKATLTTEEINILALLMKQGWIQRQVSSIEVTRMKYSGTDFKMTSQANHLAKLLSLLSEAQRESLHMQRLYKRRKLNDDGTYSSNWSSLRSRSVF